MRQATSPLCGLGLSDTYIRTSSQYWCSACLAWSSVPEHGELCCAPFLGVVPIVWEIVDISLLSQCLCWWVLVSSAIQHVDQMAGLLGQCVMNQVMLFNASIDWRWELSDPQSIPSALMWSEVVECNLLLPSTPLYSMPEMHPLIGPASPAELGIKTNIVNFCLLTDEPVRVNSYCSVSWSWNVFGEAGVIIPESEDFCIG